MPDKNHRRNAPHQAFFRLYHFILNAPAWNSLTCAQRCVYLALARRFNGHNNGEIGMSVREAASEAACNKDTAATALRALEECGLIARTTEGAFSYKRRHSATFALTHLPTQKNGKEVRPTFAFRNWSGIRKKAGPV